MKNGSPELMQRMINNEISIHAAYAEMRTSTPRKKKTESTETPVELTPATTPKVRTPHKETEDAIMLIAILKKIPKNKPGRVNTFNDVIWWINSNKYR